MRREKAQNFSRRIDLAGRLTASTDQNGSVITSTYDAAGRLTERSVDRAAGAIGTTEQTFSYDDAGRLLSSTDNNDPNDTADDAQVSKSYDALGRTTTETVNGHSVQSSYTGSRRTEIEYPNGTQVTRSYDAAGNLDAVKRDGTTVADYSYDSRNQVTGATFGNGVELSNQHDELGRMTDREYNKDGNMVAGFSYDYDEVGNKLYQEDLRDPDQSELYGYDQRDRLTDWERGELNDDKDDIVTTEADQTWTLDPVGNWKDTTTDGTLDYRDHNAVNELVERYDGGLNLIYDDNGNLTDDGEYEYAYDAFNRLKTVTRKSDDAVIAEYTYDTQNRRVSKEVTNSSGLNGTTEYVYDGWQVVEERDGGGSVEKTYTYGSYIDEPVTMTNVGSTGSPTYYYHTNNPYNVRALTDEDGDVVERYRYGAYGEPTILDPDGTERGKSVVGNPYMFQGRRMDTETGLYYYRNRYYSAQLGRFVTRDPKGYVDGYNLYEYVQSNPKIGRDPTGEATVRQTARCGKEVCYHNYKRTILNIAEKASNKNVEVVAGQVAPVGIVGTVGASAGAGAAFGGGTTGPAGLIAGGAVGTGAGVAAYIDISAISNRANAEIESARNAWGWCMLRKMRHCCEEDIDPDLLRYNAGSESWQRKKLLELRQMLKD